MATKRKPPRRTRPVKKGKRSTAPLPRIGTGPALGSAMPASEAGARSGRRRSRTTQRDRETHPWAVEHAADAMRNFVNAYRASLRGDPAALQDIEDDILDRDSHIGSHARTRVLALQSLVGRFKTPPGMEQDPDAIANAEFCQRVINGLEEWPLAIGWLAEGIIRGYAVVEKDWRLAADGNWVIWRLQWRHQNRFAFDGDLQMCRREMNEQWPGTPLEEVKADGWIVHIPMAGRATYAHRGGLMLPAIPLAFAKRHGWKYFLLGSERAGVPLFAAKVADGVDNDDLADEALAVIRKMNAHWGAVFRGAVELLKVEGTGEFTGELHKSIIDTANTSSAINFLGQALATEAGTTEVGSFAAAKISNLVRTDLKSADAVALAVDIRRQVAEPLIRVNQRRGAIPIYEFDLGLRDLPTIDDVREGINTEDERRAAMGWPAKPNGAGAVFRAPPVNAPMGMGLPPGGDGNAAGPFGLTRRTPPPTSGSTIPKGTTLTSSRGVRKTPS